MGDNTTHSTLSPSGRHRWGACPGSIREEAKYPDPPDSPAALDGTRSHALLEHCVKNDLLDPLGLVGGNFMYPNDDGTTDTFLIDQPRAERVKVAVEYVKSRVGYAPPIAEKRVHPDGLVLRADMSGTVDIQIPDKSVYEICDYKDGMSPVTAENNPQLLQYALGVLAELPVELRPKVFRLTIIQPKLALRGMPTITSWDIPLANLLAEVPVIIAQAAATDDPNAPLVPGESQCKYCKAKGACSALATKAMNEVGVMFQALPELPGAFPTLPAVASYNEVLDPAQQAADQDPTVMNDDQLRQIAEAAPLMRQLVEGVEKEIQRRLESGRPVPGFKLVNGRGSRKWALPEEEMVKKLTGMGIPKSALYETTLISPAKAEKLVWDKKGETCKLSDTQLKRMNTEYVATVVGKPSVAPESDPRQAVILDASPMFGAVSSPADVVLGSDLIHKEAIAEKIEQVVNQGPELYQPAPQQNEMPAWLQVPAWLQ